MRTNFIVQSHYGRYEALSITTVSIGKIRRQHDVEYGQRRLEKLAIQVVPDVG